MCTFCVCLGRGVKKHLVKWVGLLFTEQHREYFCTSMKYGPLIMEWKVHWTTCLFIQPFLFSCLLIEPMACFCVSSVIINRKKSVKTVVARFTVAVGKNMLLLIPMRPSYKPFTPPPHYIVSSVSYCPLHHNYAPPDSCRPPPAVFMLTLNHLSAPGAYFSADESMATPLIAQFITWSPPDIYRERCGGKLECIHLVKSQNTSPTANAELNFLFVCAPTAVSQ